MVSGEVSHPRPHANVAQAASDAREFEEQKFLRDDRVALSSPDIQIYHELKWMAGCDIESLTSEWLQLNVYRGGSHADSHHQP